MGLAYQSINSARPFRDSVTDATNGVGQLLMTRLYREQWIFWIATNLFSIYLWWGENIHIHQKNKTWVCFWKSRHKVFELFWNERSVVARDIQTAICNSFFVIYNEKIKITKKNDKSIFSKKKCFKKNLNNLKIYMLTQCFESTFTLIMMYYLGDILKKLFILWRSFFFLKPKCLLFKTALFSLQIFVHN